MGAISDKKSEEDKQNPLQYPHGDIMTRPGCSISQRDGSAECRLKQDSSARDLKMVEMSGHQVQCYPIQISGLSFGSNVLTPDLEGIVIPSSIICRRLAPWEEVVGIIYEVNHAYDLLQAKIGQTQVCLPKEMLNVLKELLGQRIAILRTEKDYRLRILGDRR